MAFLLARLTMVFLVLLLAGLVLAIPITELVLSNKGLRELSDLRESVEPATETNTKHIHRALKVVQVLASIALIISGLPFLFYVMVILFGDVGDVVITTTKEKESS